MRVSSRSAILAAFTSLLLAQPVYSQTYTTCNPTAEQCPADPALGTTINVDLTSGPSSYFDPQGGPPVSYDSTNGAAFTIQGPGDAPQLNSKFYIMFGSYEVKMKVAPGAGIVSTIVLESDDLDEIDWEFLGATPTQGQTNYFGKGQTTTYDRGGISTISDTTDEFHTYGVEWTETSITWTVDGASVRVLNAADAEGQYPQTPCMFKIGVWAGGDPSNAEGTIQWSHGPTDYSQAPFTMYVQTISISDYSTGKQYVYSDESGGWQSIEAVGGSVNGSPSGSGSPDPPSTFSTAVVPTITSSATTTVLPAPDGGPATTVTYTTYPGLPSGWTVNPTSGKVVPPSAAPAVQIPTSLIRLILAFAAGSLALGIWL